MDKTFTEKFFVGIGYLLAVFYPIVGIIIGAALYFLKKDDPFYQKHGKYMIIVGIVVVIIEVILALMGYLDFSMIGSV
ncbi:DUF4870 domain-containing protein [Methanobrevibacter sp.]|uniref:DUF4870 domain-containing protein n=1 Tax=Methanobrevibacter sp. TaxID=66852 RepID=UPI0025D7B9F9|nr:DUF4870 domain-containing protein [Methanobrevibacter sp.]MBQ2961835.1 DUF4870 domain-containing protein [Methanobrevibacter sp.]